MPYFLRKPLKIFSKKNFLMEIISIFAKDVQPNNLQVGRWNFTIFPRFSPSPFCLLFIVEFSLFFFLVFLFSWFLVLLFSWFLVLFIYLFIYFGFLDPPSLQNLSHKPMTISSDAEFPDEQICF